ncbi:unnamed protein product [Brassica oleracea]
MAKEEDMSLIDIHEINDEVQGSNKGGDFHVVDGLGEKDCPQHLRRKPPDRDQNKETSYVGPFETQERRSIGSTYTKLLEETGSVLKLDHGHHDCLSKLSLMEKHAMEYKITYLREALALEKEKNRNLEHELNEIHKQIRMLNKGSSTLDKILSMGRTEKSTIGLGYQGDPSSSQTVFVQGRSVEKNKTRSYLDNESYVAVSAPSEWLDAHKCSKTENGLLSFTDASRTNGTRDINLTTGTSLCGMSLGAYIIFFELPWTYGRHTFWDRYGNTYGFAFGGKHINLYHREETMDPVVPKEEFLSLYSPLCLYNSATFRSEAKLFGDVRFMDVMFVVFPRSYTFLKYYSTASLQTFLILGTALDVSSFHHSHLCALMHLDHYFVGKCNQTLQVKWLCLMESEGTSMALVRLVVIYPTISSPIWWKHKHLNGRLDAFDMIQFVLVYGAYTTVASLELACSTALWSLCIHIRSSAVWPLFHMDVTVPVVVIPSQWLQIGLQWGVFKPKVEVVHSPQTGSGCLLVAIICWRGIACESSNVLGDSNSAFQHVCAAAINFLIYSVFPSLSTKFSLVVWVLTARLRCIDKYFKNNTTPIT